MEVMHCLEVTEPLTFLKCDQMCHDESLKLVEQHERAAIGKVVF